MPGPYFQTIGGASKLLFVDGKLAMDQMCCCCCGPVNWEFTNTGFLGGDPWTILDAWDLEIHFEDSANCVDGGNPNTQFALAKKCLIISTDTATVTVNLGGFIERQNPGFDSVTVRFITCNGATPGGVFHSVGQASTGSGGGCSMEDKFKTDSFALPRGNYLVEVDASTVDPSFHLHAFWGVSIIVAE